MTAQAAAVELESQVVLIEQLDAVSLSSSSSDHWPMTDCLGRRPRDEIIVSRVIRKRLVELQLSTPIALSLSGRRPRPATVTPSRLSCHRRHRGRHYFRPQPCRNRDTSLWRSVYSTSKRMKWCRNRLWIHSLPSKQKCVFTARIITKNVPQLWKPDVYMILTKWYTCNNWINKQEIFCYHIM